MLRFLLSTLVMMLFALVFSAQGAFAQQKVDGRNIFRVGSITENMALAEDDSMPPLTYTFIVKGELGKGCFHGYQYSHSESFKHIDEFGVLPNYFVACKTGTRTYIMYSISLLNPELTPKSVLISKYVLTNTSVYVYARDEDGNWEEDYMEMTPLKPRSTKVYNTLISLFEADPDHVKIVTSFAKFISKAFTAAGEKGVDASIYKSSKYEHMDSEDDD